MVPTMTGTPRDPDPFRILSDLDDLQRRLSDARADQERGERLELLGTLSGMIAHEVRNIASKITGNAQLIGRHAEDPAKTRELADRIVRLGLHAGRVAEAILSAADQPCVGACNPFEVHRRAMDALPGEARSRFDDSGFPTDLSAGIDPDALERVLVNLYLNGWRAVGGSGGTGRIVVSARRSARNIELRIADDGPGLHPEIAEMVFEPWHRGETVNAEAADRDGTRRVPTAPTTGKPAGSGHGLGLALCRHLVSAAGGSIRFERDTARGAEVVVSLPGADRGSAADAIDPHDANDTDNDAAA